MAINKVNELKVVLRVDSRHGHRHRPEPNASRAAGFLCPPLSAFGLAAVWRRLANVIFILAAFFLSFALS